MLGAATPALAAGISAGAIGFPTGKPGTDAQPSFAYLSGVCFPKKRNAESNAQALGLATKIEASFVEPMECLSVSKLPEGTQWVWKRSNLTVIEPLRSSLELASLYSQDEENL